MKNLFILPIIISIFLFACKDDVVLPAKQTNRNFTNFKATDYFPLEVGNYWVYKSIRVDTLGNDIESMGIDSVVITSDTIIDGVKQFFIGSVKYPKTKIHSYTRLRDSSGCIVNQFGQIRFSVNNFTDTLRTLQNITGQDTFAYVYITMENYDKEIEVPAGVFDDLLNFKGWFYTNVKRYGVNNNDRTYNYLYQKGVGPVFQQYFYPTSSNTIEKRLIRYHIN